VISKATNKVSLIGVIKGVLTPVAIIELPSGKIDINGVATKAYISEAKGSPIIVNMPRQMRTLINLERNSKR
jgi:hypothetical protein